MKEKIYEKGDIIFIKTVQFRDGVVDCKIKGHPYILLEDVYFEGQVVKAYKITSKKKVSGQWGLPRGVLPKKSYIDFSAVYDVPINTVSVPIGHYDF